MPQPCDPERLHAYAQILERPNPPDLAQIGQVRCFEGDPDRRSKILLGLIVTWLQRRHLAVDGKEWR